MTEPHGSKVKALLSRVRQATHQRGQKSKLAKILGVPRQRVTNWLTDDDLPGGEITLRMLEWVTAEEAKQTSAPGSVTSTARSKARSTHSYHEKRKTGPPHK